MQKNFKIIIMTEKIKFENVKTIVENNSVEMIQTEEEFTAVYFRMGTQFYYMCPILKNLAVKRLLQV